jgi:hypothetical protein
MPETGTFEGGVYYADQGVYMLVFVIELHHGPDLHEPRLIVAARYGVPYHC